MATDISFEQQDFVRSDFGLRQMEGSDFGAFKSQRSHSTATTTADTQFSASNFSQSPTEEELRLKKEKKKKKKEEKKKKKEKKEKRRSSSSQLEGNSTASGSTGTKSSDSGRGENRRELERFYSKDLFDKMLHDAGFLGDFGDEFDADPFQDSQHWDLEEEEEDSKKSEWGSSSREHSRESSSRHTRHTTSTGPVAHPGPLKHQSSTGKVRIALDFQETKPFETKEDDDLPAGYDDDTVISDVTGLTGIFNNLRDVEEDFEEEDDEPDMEAIMMQLKAGTEQDNATRHAGGLMPSTKTEPQRKSCLAHSPSRHLSIQSTATAKRRPKPAQQLRFASVTIRDYERILTENPSTIQGASIGIGWRFVQRPTQQIDSYETIRGPPKPSPTLVLNREQRETLLLDLGYSHADIAASIRSNNKVRQQRRQTVQNLSASNLEERLEGAGKVMSKLLNPFGRKK